MTIDWQMMSARVYSLGSFISAAIGKKPGVPAKEKTSDETAEIASTKVGLPKSLKSDSQGPVCGAAAGRPPTPTATVNVRTMIRSVRSAVSRMPFVLLTGRDDADNSNPRKPGDSAQRLDATEDEADDCSHGDKDGSTGTMKRKCVQSDRNAEHARAGDEDPVLCPY